MSDATEVLRNEAPEPISADFSTGQNVDNAGASLALRNLRGVFILLLLSFHSPLPYLASAKAPTAGFDQPPFDWLAFPIVDSRRWLGFDIFCAWEDVFLMGLMFFISGLFVWPSLSRKGSVRFLCDRLSRLGPPFVFGLIVVMPIALYPVYRVVAVDPSVSAYISAYLALPFWPNGPMWFLWLLMAFTIGVAAIHRVAPGSVPHLGRLSSRAAALPSRCFLGLTVAAAVAYVPLALTFGPWKWTTLGPISFQLSRPLLYAIYYFAGVGMGAHGLGRGLLATEGGLARRWRVWLGAAPASLMLWMGLTGLTLTYVGGAPLIVQFASAVSYALASVCGILFMLAISLRFGVVRSPTLNVLSTNALGIYLMHYAPLVWLQYAMTGVPLFAVVKAPIVFVGTLALSLTATIGLRFVRLGARLIGEEPWDVDSAPFEADSGLSAGRGPARLGGMRPPEGGEIDSQIPG